MPKKNDVFPVRKKILATMHFFWANLFDKMWYLFLNKYLFCLYREFSSGNNFIVIIRTKKIEKTQMVQRIFRWYIRWYMVHIQHKKSIEMVCQSDPVCQKRWNLKMVMSYRSIMVRAFSKNKIVYETLL